MSGLASLLMGMGHQVSGSDKVTTIETERLEKLGLKFFCPQSADEVAEAELIIYSSAIKEGNVAFDEARRRGLPLVRRAEALAGIMDRCKGIVIAGTHGKTTTSSMSAHVLRSGGLKPSHYVGAEIPLLGTNANWEGDGSYLVAEGDESDGTLALYRPEHAIILNVEEEHLDHYTGGLEEIKAVFAKLVDQTRGFFIYCGDDPGATAVCAGRKGAVSYGWNRSCDYTATEVHERRGTSSFEVLRHGKHLGEIELGIPGRHNVLNALGVVALASELGISFAVIRAALGTFRGARRRFELKYRSDRYLVYDDYGHHPTEVAATLSTARSLEPGRLICVFQPHRYTRTKLLKDQFGGCFHAADELVVTDVYPASEKPIPGISGATICEAVAQRESCKVESIPALSAARFFVGNRLQPGDLLISLGAGNIHEVGSAIAADLAVMEELEAVLDEPESQFRLYEPMSRHTTILIGGPAQFWVEPRTVAGMARLVNHARAKGIPVRVVGRGSNLLVRDGGIPGLVIHPKHGDFESISVQGELIEAGVGVRLKRIASMAETAGLSGFEWMEGIPGELGGAIRMNAGAMDAEMFEQVVSVTYLDASGEVRTKRAEEIAHQYRSVPEFGDNYVVSAVLRGSSADAVAIQARLEALRQKRKETQPVGASAGCIFKNPEVCGAGKLVEELGFKNRRAGKARVSEVHGNFIVNDGGASAADVLHLIHEIQKAAREQRGIELETEVEILGGDGPY